MTADSSVNIPVESDSLSVQIASALSRHPALHYSTKLENSHIPAHRDMNSFFGDPFTDTFNAYNVALFDSVRQMIRYEKSLSVWSTIVTDIDSEDVRNTVIMDYIYPVFRFLSDIPNVFKDQLVRACVKLATISKGDYSLVQINTAKNGAPRYNWFKKLQKSCSDTALGNQLIAIILMRIYLNIQMPSILESFMAIRLMTLLPRWFLASTRAIQWAMPFLSKPILLRSICPMSLLSLIGTG